jgi:predicted dinucleotide-binding enzyme
VVAELVPGAQLVKTLNYEPIPIYGQGLSSTEPKALFLAGDNAAAKAKVSALIASLGAEPIDVGSLAVGDQLLKGGGALAMKMRLLKPDEARELLSASTT